MNVNKIVIVATSVVVGVALASCDRPEPDPSGRLAPGASPSAPPPPEVPSTTEPAAGRCPNEEAAVLTAERATTPPQADIDGDGQKDSAFIVRDKSGSPDCRTFLVVDADDNRMSTPTNEKGVVYALEEPRIHGFAQIDGEAGEEILVDLEHGASTQFIGIFTDPAAGDLQRVKVRENTDFGNLFPYGGSVGHFEASNCPDHPSADISVAVATANATDYTIRTRLYEMDGATLLPLPRSKQPPIMIGKDLDRIEGFATSPFGNCPRGR